MKLPKIELPSEESMIRTSTRWWEKLKHHNLTSWNKELRELTFPFESKKIPSELLNRTLTYDSKGFDFKKATEDYSDLVTPMLNNLNITNGFFFKLNSRSAKDSLYNELDYGRPIKLYDPREILHHILNSMRCFEDLCLMSRLDIAEIIIRPFITFNVFDEWRVIVDNKKIVGISQYYYYNTFTELTEDYVNKSEILIRNIVDNEIVPNFPLDSFIADIVILNDKAYLLETNPFGLSDPCLFKDYQSFDGPIKYNK